MCACVCVTGVGWGGVCETGACEVAPRGRSAAMIVVVAHTHLGRALARVGRGGGGGGGGRGLVGGLLLVARLLEVVQGPPRARELILRTSCHVMQMQWRA